MKANPYFLLSIALVVVFLTAGIAGAETLVESPQPYPNNYQNTWVISQPGANQIRLHFTKMEIGYGDTLQLLDESNNVLETYTGEMSMGYTSRLLLEDHWSEWYTLDTIKVKLVTNGEQNYYGFKIDQLETRLTDQPTDQNLFESWHNYSNDYQSTWVISQPGANQMRLHFTKMEIGYGDTLQLLDENNNVLETYTGEMSMGYTFRLLLEDYWSEWYTLDTIKVKLVTNGEQNYYGFKIDQLETRLTDQPTDQDLFESWHNYSNDYQSIWVISQPGVNQMRLHFTKMEIGYGDTLQLLDENNNVLETYTGEMSMGYTFRLLLEDNWSEWYTLDTIKVKLVTNNEQNYYGFKIDQLETRLTDQPTDQNLFESWHNYSNDYQSTWVISQPGVNQMRLHFTKMEIGYGDTLQLLDENNNVLKTYTGEMSMGYTFRLLLEDYWSEWYTLDTIKVKLVTNNEQNYYGFKIDQLETRLTDQPTDQNLFESWHNYSNDYQSTWVISQPGVNQMRLHFTKMEIGYGDTLQLLDENNNVLETYTGEKSMGYTFRLLLEDYWSEWYTLDTIKVKLVTNIEQNYYGFKIDEVDPPISINPVPPDSISNLHNTTYNQNSVTWAWTDPSSSDFGHVMVYLNDVFQGNVTKGIQVYSVTGLSPSTAYIIGTKTVGTSGLVNSTWVNQTATTAPEPSTPVPPDSISNLHNTTYNQNSVTWAWTDPSSSDFDHVMVYLNDVFQGNVTKGIQVYSVTGLSPSTAYTIGTITVGTSGLVNSTWVNQTATTAPEPPTPVPPDSISDLHNTTYNQNSVTWTWTDPSSSEFDHVIVYLNDVFQGNVSKGTQVYSATGLSPSTAYIIGTKTVGTSGLVNSTWVNQTTTTAPDSGPGILPPEAQFTSNTTSGTAPLTVQFNDSSNGTITSYAWDFGDGANSTEKNPVHTYTSYGMYNVSLTVTNTAGEDTIIKNDFIQVNPMVGGDTGYYLIHCNVDGAGVYFDEDYKGVITDGTLLVKIYLTATPYHRYSVSKVGYVTVNEALPTYPAKDETKDIFVTLVDVTDNSWTRPPYPEVTRIQPGYPDINWTRPPYPEVTRIQPGYPDTNWTHPPYPEVTKIQPGYPDTNWTRPPYPEVTRMPYPDWLWSHLSIKNFLKNIF